MAPPSFRPQVRRASCPLASALHLSLHVVLCRRFLLSFRSSPCSPPASARPASDSPPDRPRRLPPLLRRPLLEQSLWPCSSTLLRPFIRSHCSSGRTNGPLTRSPSTQLPAVLLPAQEELIAAQVSLAAETVSSETLSWSEEKARIESDLLLVRSVHPCVPASSALTIPERRRSELRRASLLRRSASCGGRRQSSTPRPRASPSEEERRRLAGSPQLLLLLLLLLSRRRRRLAGTRRWTGQSRTRRRRSSLRQRS